MSEKVQQVLRAAQELSTAEKLEFLEIFETSLEEQGVHLIDDYWAAEIERRTAELESGKVQSIPGPEVEVRIRKLLSDNG